MMEIFWQAFLAGLGMATGIALLGAFAIWLYVQGVKARWWL